jgi:LuxR family maltose regulon positive regulatory protein
MLRDRRESEVRRWMDVIPADEVERRPVLAIAFIGGLMSGGEFPAVQGRLDAVEKVMSSSRTRDLVVIDDAELARVPGAIQMYRAALALIGGDLTGTADHADRAVALAVAGDHLAVSAASALSGLASWTSGDLDTAHLKYSAAVNGLTIADHVSDVLGCSVTLAEIRTTQGRLADARRTFEDGLRLATTASPAVPLRGMADMHVGLSRVAYARNDLAAARDHLTQADALGAELGLPQNPYRSRVAHAMLARADGDLAGATTLLEEAEAVYDGDFSPNVRPVPAQRVRLLLEQAGLDDALTWVRETGLSTEDDVSYLREYEHLTLARVLTNAHVGEAKLVFALLERLCDAAEEGGRTGSLIEILTVQAIAHHADRGRHDLPGALGPLERALQLAEPENAIRIFRDEGSAIVPLLEALVRKDGSWRFLRQVLDAFTPTGPVSVPVSPELVDQLSARELDVLRLLASDLDGPAIARELVVSLNTVRTHTKNIYSKLGVNSRRAALTRAADLRLLPRTNSR